MSSEKKWVGLIDDQDFFKKNDELKRPMSPHLTIYQPQLTSLLSITHRGTGIALTGLISLASIGTYLSGEPFSTHLTTLAALPSPLLFLGKFALAWPFSYHFANGIRHLVWDMALGFELPTVYTTGYITLGVSTAAATGIAFM